MHTENDEIYHPEKNRTLVPTHPLKKKKQTYVIFQCLNHNFDEPIGREVLSDCLCWRIKALSRQSIINQ